MGWCTWGLAGSGCPAVPDRGFSTVGVAPGGVAAPRMPTGHLMSVQSVGDTATFRLAGVDRRTGPFTDVILRSGDLLVFGRTNRRIFHGVPKVRPATAPAGLGLPPGRLSITVRETGFI